MAYEDQAGVTVLFGGISPTGPTRYDDTWVYSAKSDSWTLMHPSVSPSPRYEAGMAYDSKAHRVILFGGGTTGGQLSDETWAYDYSTDTWTNMQPATHPSARDDVGMAYDSESNRIIAFGGWTGNATDNQTWAYDYDSNTWQQMSPAGGPSARATKLVYDSQADRILAFGGSPGYAQILGDTWSYDYNADAWKNLMPATSPSERSGFAVAYDSKADRTFITAGKVSQSALTDETWAYDLQANAWTKLGVTPRPPAQIGVNMVYDAAQDTTVLFGSSTGGPGDGTWRFTYPPAGAS